MEFEAIASGFCFLEAPREADGAVWFTDVVLGGVRRLLPDGKTDEWLPERRWIGGLVLNDDGSVLCSGGDGIAWFNPATGKSGMLLRTLDGKPIRGINDMQPDGQGGLYFGTADVTEADHDTERSPSALYHLDRNGAVRRLADGFIFANGIGLSPDRKHLYLSETFVGVQGYELLPDGALGPKVFQTEVPGADGLAVDSEGGIWAACIQSGTIVRLHSDGSVNERIPLASEGVTSLCFGGPDLRDIYVTTAAPGFGEALAKKTLPAKTASLYRARSPVAGLSSGRTSFDLA